MAALEAADESYREQSGEGFNDAPNYHRRIAVPDSI